MPLATRNTLFFALLLIVVTVPDVAAQQAHDRKLIIGFLGSSDLDFNNRADPGYLSEFPYSRHGYNRESLHAGQENVTDKKGHQKKSTKLTRARIISIILGQKNISLPKENQRLARGNTILAETTGDRSLNTDGEEDNRWSSWGRCSAGILGPAILVGLVGGTSADEVPYSEPVGVTLGVVGGGLLGLATFCL